MNNFKPIALLKDVIAAGIRSELFLSDTSKTFQATLDGDSGTLDAVVKIQVSNDKIHWVDALTVTLNAADPVLSDTDGAFLDKVDEWAFISAYVESISGTGAKVSVYSGRTILDDN